MGMKQAERVWKLAHDLNSRGPLAEWSRLNAGGCPWELRHHKHLMPTLLHHKRLATFGCNISENGNKNRRAFYPNVLYRPLTSRALGMVVWSRVAAKTLLEIDRKGGLDEYLLTVPDAKLDCPVAQMYRKRVVEVYRASGRHVSPVESDEVIVNPVTAERAEMLRLLGERYGEAYKKWVAYQRRQMQLTNPACMHSHHSKLKENIIRLHRAKTLAP
jgi:ribosomal protein L28